MMRFKQFIEQTTSQIPPGVSQAEWYNSQRLRKWYAGQLQPPTTAPGEQAAESSKKMKRKRS